MSAAFNREGSPGSADRFGLLGHCPSIRHPLFSGSPISHGGLRNPLFVFHRNFNVRETPELIVTAEGAASGFP